MPDSQYIPDAIGQLWNNAGTLSIYTLQRLANEGTFEIDVSASNAFVEGVSSGYVSFVTDSVLNNPKSIIYLVDGDDYIISVYPDGDNFRLGMAFQGTVVLDFTWARTSRNVTTKILLDDSRRVLVDDVAVDVTYLVGSSSVDIAIPLNITRNIFSSYVQGFANNLIFNDGSSDVISYGSVGAVSYTESVEAAHGVYQDSLNSNLSPAGYNPVPFVTLNRYVPVDASPFETPDVTFAMRPNENEIAYMRYIATREPVLLDSPGLGGGQPEWPDGSLIERNPNCWYTSKAMTCFSIDGTIGDAAYHGTLLSPRHVIKSKHIGGTGTFTYLDLNGNRQTQTVIDQEDIGGDTYVALLDAEITLDVDYATFFTDSDANAYNYRDVYGVAPSREGMFTIERIGLMNNFGLGNDYIDSDEYYWSRWNSIYGGGARDGDSSSPCFVYNGATLYLMFLAFTSPIGYSYDTEGVSIVNEETARGLNNVTFKASIKTAMDALDLRNGGLDNYNLVEVAI